MYNKLLIPFDKPGYKDPKETNYCAKRTLPFFQCLPNPLPFLRSLRFLRRLTDPWHQTPAKTTNASTPCTTTAKNTAGSTTTRRTKPSSKPTKIKGRSRLRIRTRWTGGRIFQTRDLGMLIMAGGRAGSGLVVALEADALMGMAVDYPGIGLGTGRGRVRCGLRSIIRMRRS
jgi:hypothetical protein